MIAIFCFFTCDRLAGGEAILARVMTATVDRRLQHPHDQSDVLIRRVHDLVLSLRDDVRQQYRSLYLHRENRRFQVKLQDAQRPGQSERYAAIAVVTDDVGEYREETLDDVDLDGNNNNIFILYIAQNSCIQFKALHN